MNYTFNLFILLIVNVSDLPFWTSFTCKSYTEKHMLLFGMRVIVLVSPEVSGH